MRTATNIPSLHSLKTVQDLRITSRAHRSGKRPLPTTAMMNLTMANNERQHLRLEHERLQRRSVQVARRLQELEREMDELLTAALESARTVRGETPGAAGRERPSSGQPAAGARVGRGQTSRAMVLEY